MLSLFALANFSFAQRLSLDGEWDFKLIGSDGSVRKAEKYWFPLRGRLRATERKAINCAANMSASADTNAILTYPNRFAANGYPLSYREKNAHECRRRFTAENGNRRTFGYGAGTLIVSGFNHVDNAERPESLWLLKRMVDADWIPSKALDAAKLARRAK